MHEWVVSIGLDPAKFGTHSLRRTKAVLVYRRTGKWRDRLGIPRASLQRALGELAAAGDMVLSSSAIGTRIALA